MAVLIGPYDERYHVNLNGVCEINVLVELGGGGTLVLEVWPIGCSNHLTQQKGSLSGLSIVCPSPSLGWIKIPQE